MQFEIKNRFSGEVIFTAKTESLKLAVELAVEAKSNLYRANLSGADLSGADLYRADLSGAGLYGANLYGAKINFKNFPSIKTLANVCLGKLSSKLSTELMRRDAAGHPHPEKFTEWANKGGACPYQNEDRFWVFEERKEDWKEGSPQMPDVELIRAICAEKGWKIDE